MTNWWRTSDYLYDQEEHLFFRDSTYFDKREANGAKIFWSRGNGWVMGGLVRVMQLIPGDNPDRAKFERQFQEMAQSRPLAPADLQAILGDPDIANPGTVNSTVFAPAELTLWVALKRLPPVSQGEFVELNLWESRA